MDSGVVFSGIFGNCCSSPTSRRPTPYFSRLSLLHPKLSAHSTNADSPDPVGDWLANPATLQAAQKCGLFQAAAAKLKHVQPDERATSAPALPTMPPSREPPPRKTPTEHWGQAAVTLPRPIRRTTQPNREPPPRKTPTERCGQAAGTLPARSAGQRRRRNPNNSGFRRPSARAPRHQRTRSVRPMRSTVVDLMPFMRQMLLTVVPYLRARAPSVSPERILW